MQLESRQNSTAGQRHECRTVVLDISARRRAEDQARASQLQFRQLLEKLPTAAYTCSADGLITYFNEQAVELWGREPKLNDPVDRFCGSFKLYSLDGSPLDHDRCWMALSLDEDKEYREQEIIIQRPDGSCRTALAHATPIRDETGKLIGAINVLVDITRAKQAEKAIREANETLESRVRQRTAELSTALARFESIARHVPDCFWVTRIDQNGIPHVEYVSPAWQTISGYTPEDIYANADLGLKAIVTEDLPLAQQAFDGAIAANQPRKATYRIRTKQGELRWIEDTMTPIADESGRVIAMNGIARDITEAKQAEEALRRSEKRLTEAHRVGQIGSWEWDVVADTTWWSAELYRIFRADPQQFTPSLASLLELVVPDDRQSIRDRLQATLDCDEPFDVKYRIKVDDAVRFHTGTAELIRDDAGQPLRMLGTVQDVTAQRQMEQQLRRTERLASLGTLAAGIAHEINNPMSAAWTAAETARTVKGKPEEDDMLEESLDAIVSSVQRCQVIIDKVLRFADQESSQKEPHDLNEIVRNAVRTTDQFVRSCGSQLEVIVAHDLEKPTVNAPEIEQVLINLIRNAVQAGEKTTISVRTQRSDDTILVLVTDNGRGIRDTNLEHVFDPFFTHQDTAEGTGLGLAISHRIIENHEGSIEVESHVGQGSTFTVTLPLTTSLKLNTKPRVIDPPLRPWS